MERYKADIERLGKALKQKFPQFKFYYDEDSLAYILLMNVRLTIL